MTSWEHLVSEYTGLNFIQIQNLNYVDYLTFRRDAYIHKLTQTEEGREYLDKAYRLTQTEPERGKLREKFGKKGG